LKTSILRIRKDLLIKDRATAFYSAVGGNFPPRADR